VNERDAAKARTRRSILDGALGLIGEHGFGSLGVREVARAAGIAPAALYRHFKTLDELGLVLVEESFVPLHRMLRDVRAPEVDPGDIVRRSLDVLVANVAEHGGHLRFIARERHGGSPVLRRAIRQEIRLFTSELATDLARMPLVGAWRTADINLLADLIVLLMVETVATLLDTPPDRQDQVDSLVRDVERQVRMLLLGVVGWRSGARTDGPQ
jgi:AcrR family transcriptional regulator